MEDGAQRIQIPLQRKSLHSYARHHHFRGGKFTEIQQIAEHLGGFGAQQPTRLAFPHQIRDLVGRAVVLRAHRASTNAGESQQGVANPV